MRRFQTKSKNDDSWTLDLFYKYYTGPDYVYNVISYHTHHDKKGRLERLLGTAQQRRHIQDYLWIQPHGVFSSPEKLGDWFEMYLKEYRDQITYIGFRANLEISTQKGCFFSVLPMKLNVGNVGLNSYHYDGLKFDTFPPPGCPIMTHNGIVIGHMPEDKPMQALKEVI